MHDRQGFVKPACPSGVRLLFRGAFFASQKTGLSASIFFFLSQEKNGFPLQSLARQRAFCTPENSAPCLPAIHFF
jgi:hypothetical protein